MPCVTSTRAGASRVDGGLELPPKVVQERLGHSTIAMTLDVYGHLFPRHDDSEELAAAERALLAEPRRRVSRRNHADEV